MAINLSVPADVITCNGPEAILISAHNTGKSDAILADFIRNVGVGYSSDWQGIFINGSWDHVCAYISESAIIDIPTKRITWPGGEVLQWAEIEGVDENFEACYGGSYPWIGWDDLNCVLEERAYDLMEVVCRSVRKEATCTPRVRATISEEYLSLPATAWIVDRFKIEV